jgi:hypothetical protein
MSPVSKNRSRKRGSKREWTDPEPEIAQPPLPSWYPASIEAVLGGVDGLVRTTGARELEQATCELLGAQLYPAVHDGQHGLFLNWWFGELTAAAAARVRESDDLTGHWWLLHGLAAIGAPALRSFARQQINNLLPVARRRSAYPRWLATTHQVKATGDGWRMQDTYGTRIAVLAGMSYRHGTDPSVFLFDVDACGFPTLAGAGSYDDLAQAAAAWRAQVGDTADGTEPVEVRTGDELSCLAYCDIGADLVAGDETRDRLDNWFRADRCLHDLALALRKTPLLWPEPESVFGELDLEPMATEFSRWHAEHHGTEPDREIVEALTEEWLEGALPETRYLISPHRVADRRALIADCWIPDHPDTVAVLSLLVEWTRWLGQRSGLPAELVDRAVAAADTTSEPPDPGASGQVTSTPPAG